MGGDLSTLCTAQRKPDPVEWPLFEAKMRKEGCPEAAIAALCVTRDLSTKKNQLCLPRRFL